MWRWFSYKSGATWMCLADLFIFLVFFVIFFLATQQCMKLPETQVFSWLKVQRKTRHSRWSSFGLTLCSTLSDNRKVLKNNMKDQPMISETKQELRSELSFRLWRCSIFARFCTDENLWNVGLCCCSRKAHCTVKGPIVLLRFCCVPCGHWVHRWPLLFSAQDWVRQMQTRTMAASPRSRRWLTPRALRAPASPGPPPTQLTMTPPHHAPTWPAYSPEMPRAVRTTPSKTDPLNRTSCRPSRSTAQRLQSAGRRAPNRT